MLMKWEKVMQRYESGDCPSRRRNFHQSYKKGRIIDVITDDTGAFFAGTFRRRPHIGLVDLIYSKQYQKNELIKKIRGQGGLEAHLGTADIREIEKQIISGDKKAKQIFIFRFSIFKIQTGLTALIGESGVERPQY